ncbi:hypothetical protein B0H16DRAFT_1465354 [Mycena metata]|uniref:Uncharacterized protein n=1 Tax=Mycena metata TaxID=1033252 RepID=A0AAD7MZ37_9AGAR|nr:hypothetical protein B0H16DRAFT_1465354 [Mycena metata]
MVRKASPRALWLLASARLDIDDAAAQSQWQTTEEMLPKCAVGRRPRSIRGEAFYEFQEAFFKVAEFIVPSTRTDMEGEHRQLGLRAAHKERCTAQKLNQGRTTGRTGRKSASPNITRQRRPAKTAPSLPPSTHRKQNQLQPRAAGNVQRAACSLSRSGNFMSAHRNIRLQIEKPHRTEGRKRKTNILIPHPASPGPKSKNKKEEPSEQIRRAERKKFATHPPPKTTTAAFAPDPVPGKQTPSVPALTPRQRNQILPRSGRGSKYRPGPVSESGRGGGGRGRCGVVLEPAKRGERISGAHKAAEGRTEVKGTAGWWGRWMEERERHAESGSGSGVLTTWGRSVGNDESDEVTRSGVASLAGGVLESARMQGSRAKEDCKAEVGEEE